MLHRKGPGDNFHFSFKSKWQTLNTSGSNQPQSHLWFLPQKAAKYITDLKNNNSIKDHRESYHFGVCEVLKFSFWTKPTPTSMATLIFSVELLTILKAFLHTAITLSPFKWLNTRKTLGLTSNSNERQAEKEMEGWHGQRKEGRQKKKSMPKDRQDRNFTSTPIALLILSQRSVVSILNNCACTSEWLSMNAGSPIYSKTK